MSDGSPASPNPRLVQIPSPPRIQIPRTRSKLGPLVRGLQSRCQHLRHLRTASIRRGHLLPHRGPRSAILFDTGMGIGDIHKVVTELTPLPVIVLNSHTHNDHVGGNWQFETIYAMDTDFTRQNAKGSSADALNEIATGQVCGNLPKGFDPKTYRTKSWTISKYIQDGDVLDLGGREIQIISTPGHTPDSICLFDSAAGLLFTGDTYFPAPIWLYRPETDLAAYQSSVLRLELQARNVKLVLGAHNIPVAPPSVLSKLAVAAAELESLSTRGKGRGHCKPADPGKKTCKVGDFTFLLRATP